MSGTPHRHLPGSAGPATAPGSDGLAFFVDVVGRLETVVRAETEGLRRHKPLDLGTINRQKRQGLLELSRLMPRLATVPAQDVIRDRLRRLSALLEQNRAAIDVQLRAVREVADIIAETMKEAESDGTYSRGYGSFL